MPVRTRHLAPLICLMAAVSSTAATGPFSPDAYLRHVKYLASDEMQGRGNGTPELNRAAEYIAGQFAAAGVQPGGDEGTFFQKFLVATGSRLGPGNTLTFVIGGKEVASTLGRDYVPFGAGEKTSLSGDVVFAGYGISSEDNKYDDYKDFDVTDKIVLVMAHEPRENDPASPFSGAEPTLHGEDNTKAQNAKYRGARAILIVQDPLNHEDPARDLPAIGAEAQIDELGIGSFRISRTLAQRLLDAQGKNLADLQKQIDAGLSPQTFAVTGVQARIEMDVEPVRKEVRNVVGVLPGTDPAAGREMVIVGAHYDHLGRGGRSSLSPSLIGQIHNGADDNASGTAGLIEIAAALAHDPAPRRRSYVFIAFAGEELGLRGSAYWASHPGRDLSKAVAMINMDMIGRVRNNQVILSGVGTSPAFGELVKTAATENGLELKTSQSGYGASDHTSFYTKNIPVLFFFSGLHADYHRPSDDWEQINAEGATKIVGMAYTICRRLDAMDSRPQFTKVNEPATTGSSGRGGGTGYGAYFGSIPDMTAEVKGVRFSDVRPNSPAAKAGLRGADIMIKFAGKDVASLEDFSYILRTHKPGDTIEVIVLRDGQPLTVQVTLEVRR